MNHSAFMLAALFYQQHRKMRESKIIKVGDLQMTSLALRMLLITLHATHVFTCQSDLLREHCLFYTTVK